MPTYVLATLRDLNILCTNLQMLHTVHVMQATILQLLLT